MFGLIENLIFLWLGGVIYGAALEFFNEDKDDETELMEMIWFIIIWPYSIVYAGIRGDE